MPFAETFERLLGRNRTMTPRDVALAWLARWNTAGNRGVGTAQVEAGLHGASRGKLSGIQFFFEDAQRAAMLLDVLGATEAERAELLDAAGSALAELATPPRLVVDLTPWSDKEDLAIFSAAEALFPPSLGPVAFVVTVDQHRQVPSAWGDDARNRVHRVDGEDAWAVVQRLAVPSAVVASSRRFVPFERWIALDFDGARFASEPAIAELAALPPVVHDVAELGIPAERASAPRSAREARRRVWELAHEGMAGGSPGARRGLAEALGVRAASTESERIEAALRASGIPWRVATDTELRDLLGRAARRPTPPVVLRVEDLWHLVNVEPPASLRAAPTRMQVHRVRSRETALGRLLAGTEAWTVDDWMEDPRLERLIARIDPKSEDRAALLHARTWRLLAGVPPTRPRVRAGLEGLRAIVQGAPPAAELCVEAAGEVPKGDEPILVIGPEAAGWTRRMLEQAPAPGRQILGRSDALTGLRFAAAQGEGPRWTSLSKIGRAAEPSDEGAWLDSYERGTGAQWMNQGVAGDRGPEIALTDLTPHADLWHEADRLLALTWRALRHAVARGDAEHLHDGTLLIPLGGGIFADVAVWEHRAANAPRGALGWRARRVYHQPPGQATTVFREWRREPLAVVVPMHRATTVGYTTAETTAGALLPREIRLSGAGYSAELRFVASPFEVGAVPVFTGGAVDGDLAAEEHAARRAAREEG